VRARGRTTVIAVCNKPKGKHVLARVAVVDRVPVLQVLMAVQMQAGSEGTWIDVDFDENAGLRATCACRKEFPLYPPRLRQAYREGRVVTAEPVGLWADPRGVMSRRGRAKGIASDSTPRLSPAKAPVALPTEGPVTD
jgi:hypothetical protein